MEYVRGGSLANEISKRNLDEYEVALIIKQLVSSANYCHSHNVVHRDLKPDNVMLVASKKLEIKVIDFGTARQLIKGKTFSQINGTVNFMAPEVFLRDYDTKCDMWSIGVMTFIFICGQYPFGDRKTPNAVMQQLILEGKFTFDLEIWKEISEDAKSFITQLLQVNPANRLTAAQALKHPWLTELPQPKCNKTIIKNALESLLNFHSHSTIKAATLNFLAS